MIKNKKKKAIEDDGRRIADMSSVEHPDLFGGFGRLKASKKDEPSCDAGREGVLLSRSETRAVLMNSLLAALAVAGIFLVMGAAFILFCTKIWFR